VREYVVKYGDSPASIAAQDHHAGCPKCAKTLIEANSHLPTVTYPNGFKTFRELHVGQRLRLPDAWFDGTLDAQPQSYFNSLPRHDGVTPGVGQSHQSAVDVIGAAQAVADAIATDPNFCASVAKAGSAVNTAVHEFKVAWNANNPQSPVPLGTGNLESSVSAALATVLGDKAPPACDAQPLQEAPRGKGLSTGAIVGIGLGAAALVGGVTFAVTRKSARRRRRR
jgi:hypothetical protein